MQPERADANSGPFAHIAAPYGSDEGFLQTVLPAIEEALKAGHDILVVTGQHRLDLITGVLGDDANRVDKRLSSTWYTHPARTLTAYHEYAEPWAKRQTLLIGEPVWNGRGERDTREWIRYESAINVAFAGAPITLLCLYNQETTPDHVLDEASRTHPLCLDVGGVRPSPAYVPPVRFALKGDDRPFGAAPDSSWRTGFTASDLTRVRQLVEDHAIRAGLDRDTTGSLVLSVSEIAANAVEHGSGHGTVTVWTAGGELICEVADPAGRLDQPHPGYLPPKPASARGYGLWISRQLCDLVETRAADGGLRVRLHMYLP
ncbi:sensor histidine kinase [Streptosporangium sp. KLBMP 9127]|nr:sensor histidine kinase [Streptosporangium sp. KLBMP 9127]